MPYFGATASSFSISSLVGGNAVVAPSGSGTPTSKNIFSRPAGATEVSIFAGLLLSFLKLWGVPTGMLANIPAVARKRYTSPTRATVRPCWGLRIIGFIRLVSSLFCGQCLHELRRPLDPAL